MVVNKISFVYWITTKTQKIIHWNSTLTSSYHETQKKVGNEYSQLCNVNFLLYTYLAYQKGKITFAICNSKIQLFYMSLPPFCKVLYSFNLLLYVYNLHFSLSCKTQVGKGQHDHYTTIQLSPKCIQLIKSKNRHHA